MTDSPLVQGAATFVPTPHGEAETRFVVAVFADTAALSPDWPHDGAGPARAHAFQTVPFIKTWLATYGQADALTPCLVEVRDTAGRPVLMLPLGIANTRGTRILRFLDGGVSDYNAPVLFPTAIVWTQARVEALWDAVLMALPPIDLVELDKMPQTVGGLANPLHQLAHEANPESCHLTDLSRPWQEVEKSIQSAKNLRNRQRALERLGSSTLLVASTKKERDFILDALLRQKQRRFEETRVPGFAEHPEKAAFFTLGSDILAQAGTLHLSALVVNDEVIAAYWGLVQGRHYYGLLIGYEAGDWAKYSPGRVLHYLLLKQLSAEGYECLDLGIGDEAWKQSACDVTIPLRRLIAARTPRGAIALAMRRQFERLRASRLWQAARPLKWVVLRALDARRKGSA